MCINYLKDDLWRGALVAEVDRPVVPNVPDYAPDGLIDCPPGLKHLCKSKFNMERPYPEKKKINGKAAVTESVVIPARS